MTRFIQILVGVWCTGVAALALGGVTCPQASMDELKTKLTGKGEVELVFFASWCGSCIPHLKQSYDHPVVFVATFDEQAKAEKVATAFNLKHPCFTGEAIASFLGVESLPATRHVRF